MYTYVYMCTYIYIYIHTYIHMYAHRHLLEAVSETAAELELNRETSFCTQSPLGGGGGGVSIRSSDGERKNHPQI